MYLILYILYIMSVQHTGRRTRYLLPPDVAFKQLSRQTTLKPSTTFGRAVALSLMGLIAGTIITTLGILNKQTVWIILGFLVMLLSIGWFCTVVYS